MRTYILTDKERLAVEAFIAEEPLTNEEKAIVYTVRSRAKKSLEVLALEVDLLRTLTRN